MFFSSLLVYVFNLLLLAIFGYFGYLTGVPIIEEAVKELRKDYSDIDFKKYPKTAALWNAKVDPDTDAERYETLFMGVGLVYAITALPIIVFLAGELGWIAGLAVGLMASLVLIWFFVNKRPTSNVFILTLQQQAQATQTLIDRYKSLPQSKIDEALDVPFPSESEMIERLKDVNTLMTLARSHNVARDQAVERLKDVEELSPNHPLVAEENVDVTSK